jgi:hypothetical protein
MRDGTACLSLYGRSLFGIFGIGIYAAAPEEVENGVDRLTKGVV